MKIELVSDIAAGLTPLIELMEVTTHPDTLQDRLTKALAPFGPDGPWKYAPDEERHKVTSAETEAYRQEAGEAVFAVEHSATEGSQWLEGIEAEQQEPLSPVAAWQRERRTSATLPPLEVIGLDGNAEQKLARFDRRLGRAMPSVVLAEYTKALRRPLEQDNVTMIRWVEELHGAGWSGRDIEGNVDEAMAVQALKTEIQQARLARITQDVRDARALITKALAAAEHVKATRRVRTQRPALWRVA